MVKQLQQVIFLWLAGILAVTAAPVIAPIGTVTVPAGKSLSVPITATVTNGRSLTYTITGSTNAMALVLHTNNPFWKLNVAQVCPPNAPGAFPTPFRGAMVTVTNVGDMTFMLFPEYASNTVAIFSGLSAAGFYNSNTIFHRVIQNFMIQGGDPQTNGLGGLAFRYNDEFNPQAIFSGSGQLALANSGKNTDGSQFFVTVAPYRGGDFQYTIFGQLVRGGNVLTNINSTAVNPTNSRPLADVIITQASLVPDTADTVVTLVATNLPGVTNSVPEVTNIVTVVADDGAGGRATNTFTAVAVLDGSSNSQPFFFGNTVTNIVAPVNTAVTNVINALELDGEPLYWWPFFGTSSTATNASLFSLATNSALQSLTYNLTNAGGRLQFYIQPTNNFTGQVAYQFVVSSSSAWYQYYYFGVTPWPPYSYLTCYFTFGDTPILAQPAAVAPLRTGVSTNLTLATFTNGVAGSSVTNFSASIQWGDNTITAGVITTNLAKSKLVSGQHTYTNSGAYPVTVTIQSSLGVTAAVTNLVTVMPSLSLTRIGTNSVLSWPAWASGFGVQSCSNLTAAVWASVTNFPTLAGFQNVITNAGPVRAGFYRLKE